MENIKEYIDPELSPEITARNIISRNYLKKDIPEITKEIYESTGLLYSPTKISQVARRITQGMCLRAHASRTLSRIPQTILS